MPPEYPLTRFPPASVRLKEASSSSARSRARRRLSPSRRPKSRRFSEPVSISSTLAYWPVTPMTLRTAWRSRTTSRPRTLAVPPLGASSVVIMRRAVDLPAPLGPSRP